MDKADYRKGNTHPFAAYASSAISAHPFPHTSVCGNEPILLRWEHNYLALAPDNCVPSPPEALTANSWYLKSCIFALEISRFVTHWCVWVDKQGSEDECVGTYVHACLPTLQTPISNPYSTFLMFLIDPYRPVCVRPPLCVFLSACVCACTRAFLCVCVRGGRREREREREKW
jgi:hypothetical protein